ncbi:uncharacterized protein LOC118433509 [Folsomia candida]|nr:uncharacterized protein LOC118433509 [Folsomia candida]
MEKMVGKFRQNRIMVKTFNNCYQTVYFTYMMTFVVTLGILFMYGLLKFHEKASIVSLVFIISVIVDYFLVVLLSYTFVGNIFFESTRLRVTWKKLDAGPRKMELCKRIVQSCPSIKIKMASVNFVERITALNVLDFGFHQAVSLALI